MNFGDYAVNRDLTTLLGQNSQIPEVCYYLAQYLNALVVAVMAFSNGRVRKREVAAFDSDSVEFAVLNRERTEIIPIPASPRSFNKALDDVGNL